MNLNYKKISYFDNITKSQSCFLTLKKNDITWIFSSSPKFRNIEIFKKINSIIYFEKEYINTEDEDSKNINFGKKICLCEKSGEIFLCIISENYLYIYINKNDIWSNDEFFKFEYDFSDVFDISLKYFNDIFYLFVNKEKYIEIINLNENIIIHKDKDEDEYKNNNLILKFIYIDKKNKDTFEYLKNNGGKIEQHSYNFILQKYEKKLIYELNDIQKICISSSQAEDVLLVYDNKNIKFFFFTDNKWNQKYKYIIKIKNTFDDLFLKYDACGKLWLFILYQSKSIDIYDFDEETLSLRLNEKIAIENKVKINISDNEFGFFDIICENLLEKEISIPKSEFGKLFFISQKLFYDPCNTDEDYSDSFMIDIELCNYKSEFEKNFGEFYKKYIDFLKEFIDDNIEKIRNYEKKNNCRLNITELIKNIFKKKNIFESKINLYELKYDILIYNNKFIKFKNKIYHIESFEDCDFIMRHIYINNNKIYSLINKNKKLILLKWISHDENNSLIFENKNICIINSTDKLINVFYENTEYKLLNNDILNINSETISKINNLNINDYNNNFINKSINIENKCYNSNIFTFGYVGNLNSNEFPKFYDSIENKKKYLVLRHNDKNYYFPENNVNFRKKKIINIILNVTIKNGMLFDLCDILINKSLKEMLKQYFYSEFICINENFEEYVLQSYDNSKKVHFNFDELNCVICNKTEQKIKFCLKSSIYFNEIDCEIEKNSITSSLMVNNNNMFIKNENLEIDMSEFEIIEKFMCL